MKTKMNHKIRILSEYIINFIFKFLYNLFSKNYDFMNYSIIIVAIAMKINHVQMSGKLFYV